MINRTFKQKLVGNIWIGALPLSLPSLGSLTSPNPSVLVLLPWRHPFWIWWAYFSQDVADARMLTLAPWNRHRLRELTKSSTPSRTEERHRCPPSLHWSRITRTLATPTLPFKAESVPQFRPAPSSGRSSTCSLETGSGAEVRQLHPFNCQAYSPQSCVVLVVF